MPTKADFDNLMAKTGEYVGYYQDGCNIIVGVLFDPTVPACKKGKVLDKNGHIIGNTNCPNGIYVGKYYERNTHMKKFSKFTFLLSSIEFNKLLTFLSLNFSNVISSSYFKS